MDRIITKLVDSETEIYVTDEVGQGNACHEYQIAMKNKKDGEPDILTEISFQNGPIKEFGVNGCQNEDLLYVVVDRLQGFQEGAFACRENAIALTHIQEALMWLERRTLERRNRNVEGKNIV